MNSPRQWMVTGARAIPGDGMQSILATVWGRTEQIARSNFQRQQALMAEQHPGEDVPRYADAELSFAEVEQEVACIPN